MGEGSLVRFVAVSESRPVAEVLQELVAATRSKSQASVARSWDIGTTTFGGWYNGLRFPHPRFWPLLVEQLGYTHQILTELHASFVPTVRQGPDALPVDTRALIVETHAMVHHLIELVEERLGEVRTTTQNFPVTGGPEGGPRPPSEAGSLGAKNDAR